MKFMRAWLFVYLLCSSPVFAGHHRMNVPSSNIADAKHVLDEATRNGRLNMALAMVGDRSGSLMKHAAGSTGGETTSPVTEDSIFAIASMTKLVTTIAVLQLVERGQVELDTQIDAYLPELAELRVLEGFDDDGEAVFNEPPQKPTVRELITHTSGFVYDIWNANAFKAQARGLTAGLASGNNFLNAPLAFTPGSRWEYGIGIDWLGVLVEKMSGKRLMPYFADNILAPLEMADTFYEFDKSKLSRAVTMMARVDGGLTISPAMQPTPMAEGSMPFYSGGGGLYSTLRDYGRLLQTLLNGGELNGTRILEQATVDLMFTNQIGSLMVTSATTQLPPLSNDMDMTLGEPAKWGLGFLIHPEGVKNGRGAGSGSWAGLFNSYFWIDREQGIFAIFATQVLPFFDTEAVATLRAFETAIYAD